MRHTVEPPPTSRCDRCGGQLTLVRVERAHSALGSKTNVFGCTGCGREQSLLVRQDHNAVRITDTVRQLRA